jgi:hypothetical protein
MLLELGVVFAAYLGVKHFSKSPNKKIRQKTQALKKVNVLWKIW